MIIKLIDQRFSIIAYVSKDKFELYLDDEENNASQKTLFCIKIIRRNENFDFFAYSFLSDWNIFATFLKKIGVPKCLTPEMTLYGNIHSWVQIYDIVSIKEVFSYSLDWLVKYMFVTAVNINEVWVKTQQEYARRMLFEAFNRFINNDTEKW